MLKVESQFITMIYFHKHVSFVLQAVIDIGEKEFALGLTYVELSRVKSLTGLSDPFTHERLTRHE